MRNLIFVGLPGSGKSTVGRLCAKALNLPFVDADKFLEQREGRSVADIFASSGEGYFRDLESRVLTDLCRREGIVLATGGGAVLRRENRRLLRDGGLVIFLDRSPWAIRRTLRRQGRPLLDVGCGSGILSIAALCLGAAEAFACDIDDKCVDVAYENAAINGIGRDRYTVRWGNVVTDRALQAEFGGEYDMVVANIVADVIMGISPQVRPFLKRTGLFLCSGIIDDRAAEVEDCLRRDGWEILETNQSEGWFSFLCR